MSGRVRGARGGAVIAQPPHPHAPGVAAGAGGHLEPGRGQPAQERGQPGAGPRRDEGKGGRKGAAGRQPAPARTSRAAGEPGREGPGPGGERAPSHAAPGPRRAGRESSQGATGEPGRPPAAASPGGQRARPKPRPPQWRTARAGGHIIFPTLRAPGPGPRRAAQDARLDAFHSDDDCPL